MLRKAHIRYSTVVTVLLPRPEGRGPPHLSGSGEIEKLPPTIEA
jgi:hypothetical protein